MSSMHVMDLWNIAWDNNDIFIYIKLFLFKIALQYYKYVF